MIAKDNASKNATKGIWPIKATNSDADHTSNTSQRCFHGRTKSCVRTRVSVKRSSRRLGTIIQPMACKKPQRVTMAWPVKTWATFEIKMASSRPPKISRIRMPSWATWWVRPSQSPRPTWASWRRTLEGKSVDEILNKSLRHARWSRVKLTRRTMINMRKSLKVTWPRQPKIR